MSILEIVLLVLCILYSIAFNVMMFMHKRSVRDWKQLIQNNQESNDRNKELLELCEEMQNDINKKIVLIDILLLQLCSANNDYEKFTMFFQKLHFDGVPDDILQDGNKLSEFCISLTDEKTKVKFNDDKNSPFKYVIETNVDKVE